MLKDPLESPALPHPPHLSLAGKGGWVGGIHLPPASGGAWRSSEPLSSYLSLSSRCCLRALHVEGRVCARWQRDLPAPRPHPPSRLLSPLRSQLWPQQQMSLSHSALYFTQLLLPPGRASPRKSNPPQVGRVKINAWWKVPHGKLIASPGRFFNHNRLWRPPGLGLFAQGSRLADGGHRGTRWHFPGLLTESPAGTDACRGSARLGHRAVGGGGLEPRT